MRHTVHIHVDGMPAALHRVARLLGSTLFRVERVTVAAGAGQGSGRLTVVVEAPAGTPVLEQLTAAVASPRGDSVRLSRPRLGKETTEPYHWQADGAGDSHAV